MEITAKLVNELRQKTGAGMMDCKKALTEADGDFEKAIEILRKKGASVAAKRAEKDAKEGLVLTKIINDSVGYIVEVNCETDFVAKSADFVNLANNVLEAVSTNGAANVEELLSKNNTLQNNVTDVMGKVGEKIEVSRFTKVEAENGIVIDYIHPGSKLGVLVRVDNVGNGKEEMSVIARDIAMQVAAMRPLCTYKEEVPKEVVDKEIEIYKELSRKEGKPENILDKIAQGRLNKFYQENCLIEQAFVKDNSKTVKDLLKDFNQKNGTQAKLVLFKRFQLGDDKK